MSGGVGVAVEQLGVGLVGLDRRGLRLAGQIGPAAERVPGQAGRRVQQRLTAGQRGVLDLDEGLQASIQSGGVQREQVTVYLAGVVEVLAASLERCLSGLGRAAGVVGGDAAGLVG